MQAKLNIIPDLEVIKSSDLTIAKFYNDHIIKSLPLKVEDGCQDWKAIKDAKIQPKWKYDYLIK